MSRALITPAVLAAAAGLLPGCRDPFRTYDDEFGAVSVEDLRSAKTLDLHATGTTTLEEEGDPSLEPRPDPFAGAERMDVSIEEARAWTLENNLDLKVSMIDPQIAATAVSEQEARFESLFSGRASVSNADPGQAEVFRDQFVRPWDVDFGVDVPMRTGGTLRVAMPLSRRETFPGFSDADAYATDIDFGITQPLLRNAGRRANTHFIRLATLDNQIAEASTKLSVIRQIADADRAYWLLYDATERLLVRQRQFERARDQLREAEARARGGVGPQIDVTRARAGVTRRLDAIFRAELQVKDAQRTLKRIMNLRGVDVDSNVLLVLVSEPELRRYEPDAGALVEAALDERMELLELELALAKDRSAIAYAENQKLPLVTLDYIYRIHGAGPSFGDSLESGGEWDGWGWRLGFNVAVPLGNEAAEARLERAMLSRLQRLSTRSAREQAVKQEVLNALDNLHVSWQRIIAAAQNRAMEAANYRAEQGQYRLGLRTSTDVLIAEDALAESLISEINAIVDYQIAQIDLAFATGMLQGASKVSW